MLQAPALGKLARIRHAFFTRSGGVSHGVYASLNGGVGSQRRARQRRREPRTHGGGAWALRPTVCSPPTRFIRPSVVVADEPWTQENRPRADAIVTRTPKLAIGVSTADCGPLLLADARGWRDRRRACRLARRAHRRGRGDDRRHGKARRRARAHRGGARPDDPAAELRGRAGIRRPLHGGRRGQRALLRAVGSAPATPCSISPATSPTACSAPALRNSRISRCAPMPSPSASSATAASTKRGEPDYGRHINAIALTD